MFGQANHCVLIATCPSAFQLKSRSLKLAMLARIAAVRLGERLLTGLGSLGAKDGCRLLRQDCEKADLRLKGVLQIVGARLEAGTGLGHCFIIADGVSGVQNATCLSELSDVWKDRVNGRTPAPNGFPASWNMP